ncbi:MULTISPECIES: DUF2634 domain-containing protein [Leuconostoc]|uniref:Phage related protein n=2 Tax=Leuconostoc TaxID=1243 RepID=A0ABM9V470_9LACO|nr:MULTISPECIES: DUF2634 domain-containing protein [Leuconostoc]CUW12203.1 Phage related protein [Leuconostoc inhae]
MIDYDTPVLDDTMPLNSDVQVVTLPSTTYQVINGRILGKIDGKEAMLQAIDKILRTDRFVWTIYSDQYGNDFSELIGQEMAYVKAELERMYEEALKGDDRVDDVMINSVTQTSRNMLLVNLTVTTMFGDATAESEVSV